MKFVAYPFVAAAALALIAATVPPAPVPAVISSSELPAAPERELVVQTCTSCHTSASFSGQRMSRDEWKATVVKMIGYGADIPEDKEPLIVDYLATRYPPAK